jgi:hypothetical protein
MQKIVLKKMSEGYAFKGMEYVHRGLQNFIGNIGQYLLLALLSSAFMFLIAQIPGINLIASLVVGPLIAGGFLIVAEKRFRNENTTIQDFLSAKEYLGGLVLANFLQILVICGIIFGLILLLVFPMITILKGYDFSNGVMNSGALIPIVGCVFVFFFIVMAFFVWYTFSDGYVIFGKMEGQEAMGVSRRIVMKQYTAILFFILILSAVSFIYIGVIFYFTGQLEVFSRMFEAMTNQDLDALKNIKDTVSFPNQVISTILAAIVNPIHHCIVQAAFRDINELDNENPTTLDNTIEHLIGKDEL